MKPLPLSLLVPAVLITGLAGAALANPLAAPSTLPFGSATAAPPGVQAPEAPRAWRMPAPPQAAPAVAPAAAPQQSTPAQSMPALQPKKAAETVVTMDTEAESHTLIDVNNVRFKGLDLPRLKQNLASRFATLTLDETDRAELKLDAQAFQQLMAPAEATQADTQSESSRHFHQAPRVKMRQTLPQAEQRVMGLPGSGGQAPDVMARNAVMGQRGIMNPELACSTYLQNQPRISRVLIEATELTPGMAFVLKGVCLGQARGKVEVRFPDDGRVVEARVLGWATDKIFVEMPEVTGVAPGTVVITAITADRRMTQAKPFPFWPNWVLVDVPMQRIKVDTCYSFEAKPRVRARCNAGNGQILSPGYEVPDAIFGIGGTPMRRMPIWTHRYSEWRLTEAHVGWDSHHLDLPPWAHLQSWKSQYARLPQSPESKVLRHEWNPTTQRITSKWQLGDQDSRGFLEYWFVYFKAWIPAGLRLD